MNATISAGASGMADGISDGMSDSRDSFRVRRFTDMAGLIE